MKRTKRPKWASVAFIFVLAAVVAIPAESLKGSSARATTMLGFTGGPSVRLLPPNESLPFSRVEIRWIADFVGDGKVDVFDNANGMGTPIISQVSVAPANDHTITFNVAGVINADTTYYFKITHHDPNNNRPDLTNDPAPFPLFFTGAQAIGNVFVDPGVDRARI